MKQKLIDYWQSGKIIKDKALIKAFKQVKREDFILDGYEKEAYGDYPLPILKGQTISQPTTVMIMLQALELKKTDKVLEVGAGSGYCAAIIAKLAKKVITTEIIEDLAKFAEKNLKKAGIKNVKIVYHDGSAGYEKESPYNKIIITAACKSIPEPLIKQLKENGIIIAPVGGFLGQKMIKGIKKKGKLETHSLGYFTFVPLTGEYGA